MSYPTLTHHCDGCECRFDTLAYNHHFAHDHCDIRDGIPLPLLVCNALHDRCPMNNKTERDLIGGWTSKQRPCGPLYAVRAGHIHDDDTGRLIPTTWLTLGDTNPPPRPKPQAPRPPAALRGRRSNSHASQLELL